MLCKHSRKTSDQRNLEKFLRSFFELYGQPRLLPFRPVFLTKPTFRDRVAPEAVKNHKPCDISPPKDLLPLVLQQMTVNIWYWNIPLPDFDQEVKKYKKTHFSFFLQNFDFGTSKFDFWFFSCKTENPLHKKGASFFWVIFFSRRERDCEISEECNFILFFSENIILLWPRMVAAYDIEKNLWK